MKKKDIDIESIRSFGGINTHLLNTWADACSILLEEGKHKNTVPFSITGPIKGDTNLSWKAVANKNGYDDREEAAGMAGYGMSLLILTTFADMIPVSRRAKGDGIDIVCSKEIKDEENFLNTTKEDYKIECKGSQFKKYCKPYLNAGIKQSKDAVGSVYVISTEFETPSALTYFRNNENS